MPEVDEVDEFRGVVDGTGVDELAAKGSAMKDPSGAPCVDRDELLTDDDEEDDIEVDDEVLEILPVCVCDEKPEGAGAELAYQQLLRSGLGEGSFKQRAGVIYLYLIPMQCLTVVLSK